MSLSNEPESLVKLSVMGIALDTRTGTPIVVLTDQDKRRALPIWIGTAEASAIIRQLEGVESNRPMTHDLLYNLIELTGYVLNRVVIKDIENDTYFASLYLSSEENEAELELDARPSDAVAVALRADAPIFASPHVMSDGTVSADEEKDEEESEAFKDFLKNIKASDFNFPGDIQSDQ
jgi:bifunctional DNase/RNase